MLEDQHCMVRATTCLRCCVVVKITNNHMSQSVDRQESKEGRVQEQSSFVFLGRFFAIKEKLQAV